MYTTQKPVSAWEGSLRLAQTVGWALTGDSIYRTHAIDANGVQSVDDQVGKQRMKKHWRRKWMSYRKVVLRTAWHPPRTSMLEKWLKIQTYHHVSGNDSLDLQLRGWHDLKSWHQKQTSTDKCEEVEMHWADKYTQIQGSKMHRQAHATGFHAHSRVQGDGVVH